MSIPPISAIGAAVNAAKASSAFAAGMAEGVSGKMGAFADALAGGELTDKESSVSIESAGDSTGQPTPGSRLVAGVIADLKEKLGISFEGLIELRLDSHDQVSIASEHGFADRDFESRMKLQSHINGSDSIRTQVAEALAGQVSEIRVSP